VTGTVASTAYLLAMLLDMRLTGNRYDDRILWGGYLTDDRTLQKTLGTAIHTSLGIVLAGAYGMAAPFLPKLPGPWRGLLFAEGENTLLFPLVPLMSALHPEVRRGGLPRLGTVEFFLLEAVRHAIYGLVLGTLWRDRE